MAIIAVIAIVWASLTARVFVWPRLEPLPDHASAIVELGGPGDRDSVALALAKEHRADYVVQSTIESDALSDTCLPHVNPDVTVLCIHAEPNTTRGEAQYIARLAQQLHWQSVILVTTPDQAWRARLRVARCFSGPVYVATTPLPLVNWLWQIPYQWGATAKALTFQRAC